MKKIILTLAIVLGVMSVFAQGQKWEYKITNSDFDGVHEFASTVGIGHFPYNNPSFSVRYEVGYDIELLVWNINTGFVTGGNEFQVKFNDGTRYYGGCGNSKSGEVWFLYVDDKEEFIERLKSDSGFSLRIITPYKDYDYKFRLAGSTTAINHVMESYLEDYEEMLRNLLLKEKMEKDERVLAEKNELERVERNRVRKEEEEKRRAEEERERIELERTEINKRLRSGKIEAENLRIDKLNNPEKYAEIAKRYENQRLQRLENERIAAKAKAKADRKAYRKSDPNRKGFPSYVAAGSLLILLFFF